MHFPLLNDLLVIFALSMAVLLLCHRLRVPATVGFLLTGVFCGPHGFGLVSAIADVQTLAEIGIVLLLFTVGLEFSIKKIFIYKRFFLLGGALQVSLTATAGYIIGQLFGRPMGESLFLGFLLALSSTAIVLRMLEERGESDSPQGKLITGILVFQDIVAVFMLLLTPLMAGSQDSFDPAYFYKLGAGLLILVGVVTCGYYVVPRLFYRIARTRSRELFLLSVLTVCFSVAWLAAGIGLSLSLGAFLAGLIVSDSEYKNQAVGDILPFEELFTSFFFVSVGMLLDINFVIAQPLLVVAMAAGILLLKTFTGAITVIAIGMPIRVAILTGVALSQIGEFSFVVAKSGMAYGLGSDYYYQLFLAVSLLSMAATPFIMRGAPFLVEWILKCPLPMRLKTGFKPIESNNKPPFENHVIIIGFGFNGRNLALTLKQLEIPYAILEMNVSTVRTERLNGEPIYFGDATHPVVLEHLNIKSAKAVVVVINDPLACIRIIEQVKHSNPSVYLVVRARYLRDAQSLMGLGADEVVTDEFGSSLEVFTRVLNYCRVPYETIEQCVEELRVRGRGMNYALNEDSFLFENFKRNPSNVILQSIRLHDGAPLVGQQLGICNLRKEWGLSILLIKRNKQVLANLSPEETLCAGDVCVIVGNKENFTKAEHLFQTQPVHT